ncbi:MAG: hypothetical protein ABSF52_22880 [Syntrophobacteraceae bacterium]|jgi:hypothetical protein
MPETEVLFFAENDGSSPILEWLDRFREIDLAVDRKNRFAKNPLKHTWREKE